MSIDGERNTKALISLVSEGFASRLSSGIIAFALPLYARSLGMSLAEIGLLVSLNSLVAFLLKPSMGRLADRIGFKRGLTVAVAARSAVAALYAVAGAPWQLFTIRASHGAGKSLRVPTSNALVAEHGGERTIASAYAWYQTAKTLASTIGKALAGVLLTLAFGFEAVFLVAFALSAVPLVLLGFVPPDGPRTDEPVETRDASEAAVGTGQDRL